MKTKIFFSTFLAIVLAIQTNAQIKVLSNGTVAIGTTTVPSDCNVNIYGYRFIMGGVATYSSLKIDCGVSDPRIWNASGGNNQVNFYNSDNKSWVDVQCRTLYQNSDIRNKMNIASLTDGLKTVKKLNGVSFNWKLNANKNGNKKNFGFIAQDVEPVIPDIVITDSTGNKMISYSSFIPYLVEAIKELSAQVDDQIKQITDLKGKISSLKSANISSDVNTTGTENALLNQNTPNPFNQNTTITYYLPETIKSAMLCIYNMQGNQIKAIAINDRGNSNVIINGSELNPGMYLYTLIADGKDVDTKRMILTN